MGFNDWNAFGCNVNEAADQADRRLLRQLRPEGRRLPRTSTSTTAGRRTAATRTASSCPTRSKFPDGIKGVADYVHSKGLKLGIYEDAGTATCAGLPRQPRPRDARTRRPSRTGASTTSSTTTATTTATAPARTTSSATPRCATRSPATGRPIVYSLCEWGEQTSRGSGPADVGNSWRTTGDISDNWSSMLVDRHRATCRWRRTPGPGHWNDPDMLEVGNGGMTDTEYRTHFCLWSMMDSPLLIGTDLRKATPQTLAILAQQGRHRPRPGPAGQAGAPCCPRTAAAYVFVKPLAERRPRRRAVQRVRPAAADLHHRHGGRPARAPPVTRVRDLWSAHRRTRPPARSAATVPAHGTVMLRVAAAPSRAPARPVDPPLLDAGRLPGAPGASSSPAQRRPSPRTPPTSARCPAIRGERHA